MSYTYAGRKQANSAGEKKKPTARGPSLDALRSGSAAPTQEQMGRRVDLPQAMREKMENAFGADLSAVKLYESQAVEEAGANAVARGSNIAFAPGMLDFTTFGGQALLGHEISHVVSQARGEVTGSGFLNNHALEARADREGAMAAAGHQISPPTTSLSAVTAAPATGPMQAGKKEERQQKAWTNFTQAQDDIVSNTVNLALGRGSYKERELYKKNLAEAKTAQNKWRDKLAPGIQTGPLGLRVLQSLREQSTGNEAQFLNQSNTALDLLGEGADRQAGDFLAPMLQSQYDATAEKYGEATLKIDEIKSNLGNVSIFSDEGIRQSKLLRGWKATRRNHNRQLDFLDELNAKVGRPQLKWSALEDDPDSDRDRDADSDE